MSSALQCLRPYQPHRTLPSTRATLAYVQLYNAAKAKTRHSPIQQHIYSSTAATAANNEGKAHERSFRLRTTPDGEQLDQSQGRLWPRVPKQETALDVRHFRHKYSSLKRDETRDDVEVVVRGRIWSIRKAGAKLAFIDIVQDGVLVQCILNRNRIEDAGLVSSGFRAIIHDLHRGDSMSINGYPHRSSSNELSILANKPPLLLSRCLNSIPEHIQNQETKMQNRHVDFLVDKKGTDILRLRSEILKLMRQFFTLQGFVDVQTPILADAAGGAIARPFQTTATEFEERKLALRIAPELWLKKMIIGGFEKIYEIGPSFRNEGIDLNHNPEFWTCEFYKTYTDLDELIYMTEKMFFLLAKTSKELKYSTLGSLKGTDANFDPPYRRIDFIPALENAMNTKFPDLTSSDVEHLLVELLRLRNIKLPSPPTIPRILDKLCATYLEPQCKEPAWIINHPECLSPLSKSFDHPENGQRVAARAELFVNKHELVNTYEEENSPIEQRRKFEMQLRYKDPETPSDEVDETYLEALQWGMPPTGGWGCGIERLVMLFAGTGRIADTLSFGTLRNVVSKSQQSFLTQSAKSAIADTP